MIRHNLNITVFLINNDGYTIERLILDGEFNDIQPWKYHQLPEVYGGQRGFDIHTETDLEDVLEKLRNRKGFQMIELHVDRWDTSLAMERAIKHMKEAMEAL